MKQRLMQFIKNGIKLFTVRPYYLLRDRWPCWHAVNWRARRRFKVAKPSLNTVQKRIVDDFRRDGIAITTLEELFPGEGLLERFQSYLKEHRYEAQVRERKSFYIDLWDSDNTLLSGDNPFVPFSFHPRILDIVNSYMGLWVRFHAMRVVGTEVVGAGATAVQSQLWHRDPEDKKMVKFFLYLNDVDEATGPFMYACGTHAHGPYYGVAPHLPKYHPGYRRVADTLIEEKIPRDKITVCTGPAGTLVFADTIGLHKGGYSTEKSRWMFSPSYRSDASISHRKKFILAPGFKKNLVSLYPPARYAVEEKYFSIP